MWDVMPVDSNQAMLFSGKFSLGRARVTHITSRTNDSLLKNLRLDQRDSLSSRLQQNGAQHLYA